MTPRGRWEDQDGGTPDGYPEPDDHMHPVAWRERQFLAAISVEGDNDDEE